MHDLNTIPLLAAEQSTSLSMSAIIMFIFACLVLYGGFFWCTKIAWDNRGRHQEDQEQEDETTSEALDG